MCSRCACHPYPPVDKDLGFVDNTMGSVDTALVHPGESAKSLRLSGTDSTFPALDIAEKKDRDPR